ncbi:MAG: helix-turn-helix domain-containing protein [Phormidesmis sp. CAN_BIN44]|nr:helix-turn-helix domain-containing protein [Phormidesmis sp. CAN_BIN44]
MLDKAKITQGTDNVFEDLGFDAEEAINLRIRADLMLDLRQYIHAQDWTQEQAAAFFGETQPRISNLINGNIDRFSVDKLINMLTRAGMDVRVEVSPKAA